jgi:hypothetical protein
MKTLSTVGRRFYFSAEDNHRIGVGVFIMDCIQAWGEAFLPRRQYYPHIVATYEKMTAKYGVRYPRPPFDPTRVPIFLDALTRFEMQPTGRWHEEDKAYHRDSSSRDHVDEDFEETASAPSPQYNQWQQHNQQLISRDNSWEPGTGISSYATPPAARPAAVPFVPTIAKPPMDNEGGGSKKRTSASLKPTSNSEETKEEKQFTNTADLLSLGEGFEEEKYEEEVSAVSRQSTGLLAVLTINRQFASDTDKTGASPCTGSLLDPFLETTPVFSSSSLMREFNDRKIDMVTSAYAANNPSFHHQLEPPRPSVKAVTLYTGPTSGVSGSSAYYDNKPSPSPLPLPSSSKSPQRFLLDFASESEDQGYTGGARSLASSELTPVVPLSSSIAGPSPSPSPSLNSTPPPLRVYRDQLSTLTESLEAKVNPHHANRLSMGLDDTVKGLM